MTTLAVFQAALELWGAMVCLICFFIIRSGRKSEYAINTWLMAALMIECVQLLSDAAALFFRGKPGTLAFYMVRISNFDVFLSNFALGIVLAFYVTRLIVGGDSEKKRRWRNLICLIGAAGAVLLIISQFTGLYYYFDESNIYHRASLYWLNMFIAFLMILNSVIMVMRFRKNIHRVSYIAVLIYLVFPLLMVVVQLFVYGISLTNIANAMAMLFLVLVHESDKSSRIIEQEQLLSSQKVEISEARVNLMISQIQPHFISNTLLTIQGMYNEGSEKADEIMNSFIHYLQQSFSELSSNKSVGVSSDIKHAINYSKIAMARWPDMTIEYDIMCESFSVPAMTIQPLVENAVRHGLLPLESGGRVLVSTYEDEKYNYISVTDNGVGFDVDNPVPKYQDGRAHIGLSNIRDRIRLMCDGEMKIKSAPGEGTEVIIKIPKE